MTDTVAISIQIYCGRNEDTYLYTHQITGLFFHMDNRAFELCAPILADNRIDVFIKIFED